MVKKAKKAYLMVGNMKLDLVLVSKAALDRLMKSKVTKGFQGYPHYFDETGRVWPRCKERYEVVFKE